MPGQERWISKVSRKSLAVSPDHWPSEGSATCPCHRVRLLDSLPYLLSRPVADSHFTIGCAFHFHVGQRIYPASQAVIRSRHLDWSSPGVVFLFTVPKISSLGSVEFPDTAPYISMWIVVRTDQIWTPPLFSFLFRSPAACTWFRIPFYYWPACVVGLFFTFHGIKLCCVSLS